jgi:hypothetical protein
MATLILLAAVPAAAQQAPAPAPFTLWFTAAPPLSLPTGRGAAAITAQFHRVVVSARVAGWDDPCENGDCFPNFDLGGLVGYGLPAGGRWHAYAAAGLAAGQDDDSGYLAIPLQAEVAYRPLGWLGVGLMGFASIATSSGSEFEDPRSFGGVALALQLGKLR